MWSRESWARGRPARGCCWTTFWRRCGGSLYARGLRLHGQFGFSFYDSLIVAAALEAGCSRLYSEDLHHGQQVERLTIQNPFQEH